MKACWQRERVVRSIVPTRLPHCLLPALFSKLREQLQVLDSHLHACLTLALESLAEGEGNFLNRMNIAPNKNFQQDLEPLRMKLDITDRTSPNQEEAGHRI